MEPKTILIRGARELITVRGIKGVRRGTALRELCILQDGSLLIRGGKLLQVGLTRRVENLEEARGATEIDVTGKVVMPGFVDCHTHLVFPPPGNGDLEKSVRLLRASSAKVLQGSLRRWGELMVRHGTTTSEVGCGSGEPDLDFKVLRAVAGMPKSPLEFVASFLFRPGPGEPAIGGMPPKVARRGFARLADVAWDDPEQCEMYSQYLQAAGKLGFRCKVQAGRLTQEDAVRAAVEQHAVSVDCAALDGDAAAMLGHAETVATLMPCSAAEELRHQQTGRELVERGAAVALGSDFRPHAGPTCSMQTVIAAACRNLGLTVEEAISAATINAAHALDCSGRVGSLEAGKDADLIVLNTADHRDLGAQVGVNLVYLTMKTGHVVYREGSVVA